MGSVINENDTVGTVESALARLTRKGVTYDKVAGYFVSKSLLKKVEDSVHAAMRDTNTDPNPLIELNDQINKLRSENEAANLALKNMTSDLNTKKADFAAAQEHITSLRAESSTSHNKLNATRKTLVAEIDALEKRKSKLSPFDFDPEVAKRNVETMQEMDNDLKQLTKALEETKASKTRINAEIAQAHMDLQTKGQEIAGLKSLLASTHADRQSVAFEGAVAPIPIALKSPTIERLLGAKGLRFLQDLDNMSRENLRERAYLMMNAAKYNKNQFWKGMHLLLEKAWQWIKSSSYKVRQKVGPWLDMVETDIRNNVFKPLSHYRIELEKIVDNMRKEAAVTAHDHGKQQGRPKTDWRDHTYAWAMVLYRRTVAPSIVKSRFNRVLSAARRFASWSAGVFKGFWPGTKHFSDDYESSDVIWDSAAEKP